MSQVTANGHTYSDDGSSPLDMRNGGHRQYLLPMLGDVMHDVESDTSDSAASAANALESANEAANSAASAQVYATALTSTSTTTNSISLGSKTFATQSGKQYFAGQWVTVTDSVDNNNWVFGQVTSYSGTTLILTITRMNGSGSVSSWNISISGVQPPESSQPPSLPRVERTGNVQITALDKGVLIDIISGSFTQTFESAALLGIGWWCYIRNNGSGYVTLAAALDGISNRILSPGTTVLLQGDGALLHFIPILNSSSSVGDVLQKASTTLDGYLLCNGASYASSSYPTLLNSAINNPYHGLHVRDSAQVTFDIAYGNGVYTAIGGPSATAIRTSSDCITWTTRDHPFGTNEIRGVVFENGLFVAWSSISSGVQIATSPDGVTWTSRMSGVGGVKKVVFGNGVFVAVGTSTNNYSSTDGVTWTPRTNQFTSAPENVVYVPHWTLFVTVGNSSSSTCISTSSDGITWVSRLSATSASLRFIAYSNNSIVAISVGGGPSYYSNNGTTWSTSTFTPFSGSTHGVIYANGLYIITGRESKIKISTDGVAFYDYAFPSTMGYMGDNNGRNFSSGIQYSNGAFITSGSSSAPYFSFISSNGRSWDNLKLDTMTDGTFVKHSTEYTTGVFVVNSRVFFATSENRLLSTTIPTDTYVNVPIIDSSINSFFKV